VVVLQPKEYEYLPELVVKIVEKRLSVKGPITQSLGLSQMIRARFRQALHQFPGHQWSNFWKASDHVFRTTLF
jgi:hypothetical protein